MVIVECGKTEIDISIESAFSIVYKKFNCFVNSIFLDVNKSYS